jgi:hypothetical protein
MATPGSLHEAMSSVFGTEAECSRPAAAVCAAATAASICAWAAGLNPSDPAASMVLAAEFASCAAASCASAFMVETLVLLVGLLFCSASLTAPPSAAPVVWAAAMEEASFFKVSWAAPPQVAGAFVAPADAALASASALLPGVTIAAVLAALSDRALPLG